MPRSRLCYVSQCTSLREETPRSGRQGQVQVLGCLWQTTYCGPPPTWASLRKSCHLHYTKVVDTEVILGVRNGPSAAAQICQTMTMFLTGGTKSYSKLHIHSQVFLMHLFHFGNKWFSTPNSGGGGDGGRPNENFGKSLHVAAFGFLCTSLGAPSQK